jgi:N-acetylmuramoyl-L-alanine amidase
VTVSAQSLNVRSGPGQNFSVVQVVNQGEMLEVFGNAPGWLYVKFQSDKFGWVNQEYTSQLSVAPSG